MFYEAIKFQLKNFGLVKKFPEVNLISRVITSEMVRPGESQKKNRLWSGFKENKYYQDFWHVARANVWDVFYYNLFTVSREISPLKEILN